MKKRSRCGQEGRKVMKDRKKKGWKEEDRKERVQESRKGDHVEKKY